MPTKTRTRYPRFLALDEAGRTHALQVMPGRRVASRDDPFGCRPVPRRIVDEDGQVVERIERGVYVTLSGVRLTSDDPEAL